MMFDLHMVKSNRTLKSCGPKGFSYVKWCKGVSWSLEVGVKLREKNVWHNTLGSEQMFSTFFHLNDYSNWDSSRNTQPPKDDSQ